MGGYKRGPVVRTNKLISKQNLSPQKDLQIKEMTSLWTEERMCLSKSGHTGKFMINKRYTVCSCSCGREKKM